MKNGGKKCLMLSRRIELFDQRHTVTIGKVVLNIIAGSSGLHEIFSKLSQQ
ncbi:hypothetical protein TorRG33x02_112500 [Trema orientale]|uniref:Uncharacterized protein n=1 Tax=Trema orientale TaxID=63057 RepID=A0A2P5F5A3_TREOI|nr:hypothetical protein TorRG33x02_112500 [Trema orientale]